MTEQEKRLKNMMKAFARLSSAGVDTERKLNDFRIDILLDVEGITVAELTEIREIQKQNRDKRLYSYLMGSAGATDQPEE